MLLVRPKQHFRTYLIFRYITGVYFALAQIVFYLINMAWVTFYTIESRKVTLAIQAGILIVSTLIDIVLCLLLRKQYLTYRL